MGQPLSADLLRKMHAYWRVAYVKQDLRDKLIEHKQYVCKYGDDMPEIRDWKWGG